MGVKATLAGLTFTTNGKNSATAMGCDLNGLVQEMQLRCQESINTLNYLITDVLTPAGTESANITTLTTMISNLS